MGYNSRIFCDGTNQPIRIDEINSPDFEADLARSPDIADLIHSEEFAPLLYRALCDTLWRHKGTDARWQSSSWVDASGIIATLRGEDWNITGWTGAAPG